MKSALSLFQVHNRGQCIIIILGDNLLQRGHNIINKWPWLVE